MVLASLPWLSDKPTLDELFSRPAWQRQALCRGTGPDAFFAIGESTPPAKAICGRCPVRAQCLAYAVEHNEDAIWGATTRAERKARRGKVVSESGHTVRRASGQVSQIAPPTKPLERPRDRNQCARGHRFDEADTL